MQSFYLIRRRLRGRSPKFVDVHQLADASDDVSIHLFALITEYRKRCFEAAEYLLDQCLRYCLGLFVSDWKPSAHFVNESIQVKMYVASVRLRMRSGQVNIIALTWCTG